MPSSHSVFWSVFPSGLPNTATQASNPSSLLSIEIPTAWSEFILAAMTSDRDVFCCFCERQVNLKIPNLLPDDSSLAFSYGKPGRNKTPKSNNTKKKPISLNTFVFICHYKLVLSRSQNSQRLKIRNSYLHKEIRWLEHNRSRFSKPRGRTSPLFLSNSRCWALFNL